MIKSAPGRECQPKLESRNRPWHEPSLGAGRAGGPSPGWAEAPQTRRSHRTWHSAAAGSSRAKKCLWPGGRQRRVQGPWGRGRSREQEGPKRSQGCTRFPEVRGRGGGGVCGGEQSLAPGDGGRLQPRRGRRAGKPFSQSRGPTGDAKPCDQPAEAQTPPHPRYGALALTCAPPKQE